MQVVNSFLVKEHTLKGRKLLRHISASSEDRACNLEDARGMEQRVAQWLRESLEQQAMELGGTLLVLQTAEIYPGMVTCVGYQKADVY